MRTCRLVTDKWQASWWLGKSPVWSRHRQAAQSVICRLECWGTSILSWYPAQLVIFFTATRPT